MESVVSSLQLCFIPGKPLRAYPKTSVNLKQVRNRLNAIYNLFCRFAQWFLMIGTIYIFHREYREGTKCWCFEPVPFTRKRRQNGIISLAQLDRCRKNIVLLTKRDLYTQCWNTNRRISHPSVPCCKTYGTKHQYLNCGAHVMHSIKTVLFFNYSVIEYKAVWEGCLHSDIVFI